MDLGTVPNPGGKRPHAPNGSCPLYIPALRDSDPHGTPPLCLSFSPLQNGTMTELRSVVKTQCETEVCSRAEPSTCVFICIHGYTNRLVIYSNRKAARVMTLEAGKSRRDGPAASQEAFSLSHGGRREGKRRPCSLSQQLQSTLDISLLWK